MIAPRGGIIVEATDDAATGSVLAEARRVLTAVLQGSDSPARTAALRAWIAELPRHFQISDGLLVSAQTDGELGALFIVMEFEGFPGEGYPHKAYLSHEPERGWAVEWILAQCASCFGNGVIHDTPGKPEACATCGGFGWGFGASRPFAYIPEQLPAVAH